MGIKVKCSDQDVSCVQNYTVSVDNKKYTIIVLVVPRENRLHGTFFLVDTKKHLIPLWEVDGKGDICDDDDCLNFSSKSINKYAESYIRKYLA